jgi:hypothetical protein
MRKIKIFLTMLAVAGVLFATSSCVDDSESTSVENLRGAKAAQLQAQADLAKAQAQAEAVRAAAETVRANAEEIKANAEATKAAAEAAYNDALAALTTNQSMQVEAETAYLKEKYKADLEKLQSDVALAVAKNQATLDSLAIATLIQQTQLNLALKLLKSSVNDSIQKKLGNLVSVYTATLGSLNSAANALALAEANLTKAKLNLSLYLADTARLIDSYILSLDSYIASSNKEIESYERLIAELDEFDTNPDADSIIAVREKELAAAVDTIEDLYKAKVAAQVELDTANAILTRADARKTAYVNATGSTWQYITWSIRVSQGSGLPAPTTAYDGYKTYNYKSSGDYIEGNNGTKYYFVGYSFNRQANLYTWSIDQGGVPYYYIGTINIEYYGYTSKEDYEARSDIAKWEQEIADAEKVIADAEEALPALYESIESIGKQVNTTEAKKEKAYTDYTTYMAGLTGSPTVDEMTYANAVRKAYDGELQYTSVPDAVRDSTGGAVGAYNRAKAAYELANAEVIQLRNKIDLALGTISNNTEYIDGDKAVLEALSYGPLEKLNAEIAAAQTVKDEKQKISTAAAAEYDSYVKLTSLLREEIISIAEKVYGIFTSTYYDYVDNWYYYDATQYLEATASWLKQQKENYADWIRLAQTEIAGYELKKDRAIAALYGGNYTNPAYDGPLMLTLIPEVIDYYNKQIGIADKNKKSAEEEIAVYTKQLELLKAAIDALLATEAE